METVKRSYHAAKEQNNAIEHKEPINTIITIEAENRMESLQLPEESKKLNLDKDKPKPEEASTKKFTQSLVTTKGRGARYHGYPTPLTAKTEAANKAEPPPAAQGAQTAQDGRSRALRRGRPHTQDNAATQHKTIGHDKGT